MSEVIKRSSSMNCVYDDRVVRERLSVNEQLRTQISSGHRLIRLARTKRYSLYSQQEFHSKAISIAADY